MTGKPVHLMDNPIVPGAWNTVFGTLPSAAYRVTGFLSYTIFPTPWMCD